MESLLHSNEHESPLRRDVHFTCPFSIIVGSRCEQELGLDADGTDGAADGTAGAGVVDVVVVVVVSVVAALLSYSYSIR